MYAVIRTGGKQYKVKTGDLLKVEKLEKNLGDEFDMNEVLFVAGKSTHVGEPTVSNAKVTVVVTQQSKNAKVIVFKKKRRQGYRRTSGHRQPYTELFVKAIVAPDGEADTASKNPPVKNPAEAAARKEAAVKAKSETGEKTAAPKAKKAAAKKATKKATKKKTASKKTTAKKATKKASKK